MGATFLQSLLGEIKFDISEDNWQLRAEQLSARLRMYPMMVGGQFLLAPLFVWMLWSQESRPALLGWLGCLYAVHLSELWLWWKGREKVATPQGCRWVHRQFLIFTALIGSLWGFAAFYFFPAELAYQALLICVMLGLMAGAVTMNPVHSPSLFIYVLSIATPLIVRVALEGDTIHYLLAAMLVLYLAVVLNAGRSLSATFWTSLCQRFENTRLVQQLTEEKAKAEMASREKSRFLAAASHDLRQPMQALVLFNDALRDAAKDQNVQRLAGQIDKSVSALVTMFDELLDVSRLDAGVVQPRIQNFELQPLLDRLYGEFAPLAQAKGLSFDIPVGEWVLFSDPFLAERILSNLIANAIRYTFGGGIQVRCLRVAEGWRIQVEDTGIGISANAIPHIFEEYYQVDNPHRDRRKGLGLGLAIVRRVEALLGTRVEVQSEPGKGSVFGMILPEGDAALLEKPFIITQSRYDLGGAVVALVEDDPDIRRLIEQLIGDWGCNVVAGEHTDEVMGKLDLAKLRPDLLVCDYRLPHGRTAIHTMQQMTRLWGAVPTVVLTGDTGQETLQEIRDSGAALLHKPIAPMRLRAMMHFVLQKEAV